MTKLTSAERANLPASAFVFPEEREIPLLDRSFAYDALRAAKEETLAGHSERAEKIRLEVAKRFNIGVSGAEIP